MSTIWIVILVVAAAGLSFKAGRALTEREIKEVEELSIIMAGAADDIGENMEAIEERLQDIEEGNEVVE